MASRVITGTQGTVGGMNNRVFAWTANLHADVTDSSNYGGSGWRNRDYGLVDVRDGMAAAYLTEGTSFDNVFAGFGIKNTLTLQADTGCYLLGGFCISDIIFMVDENKNDVVTFRFASDGPVTLSWNISS